MPRGSSLLVAGFSVLAVLVAGTFVAGVHVAWRNQGRPAGRVRRATLLSAVGAALWMGLTGAAAGMGWLRFDPPPRTMLPLFAAVFAIAFGLGLSRVGRTLAAGVPLAVLVGVQGFRFPLELLMHRAADEGLMPVRMSFSGRNFDILTGIAALVVAAVLAGGRGSPGLVRAWNVAGALLLANVLAVALLSAPTPLQVFHGRPDTTWVTEAPYVWLPTVLVLAALLGHILVARRLRMMKRGD
jgi:hypothetical protein